VETPYPMLVLVGPQGAGKRDLAQKLVEEFSDYFGYGLVLMEGLRSCVLCYGTGILAIPPTNP